MLTPTDSTPPAGGYVSFDELVDIICEDEPVELPANITRIETQADLYTYGVVLLGFQEVANEAEAIQCAEGRDAFLLKSQIMPCSYLIFPHVIVSPYTKKG